MVSDLVARIRQWLMKPGVMEAVRSAVRECVSEELASNTGPWDLLERPSSELSLQEKCALLAVHHDEVFPEDPVNLWHGLNRQQELADEEVRNQAGQLADAKRLTKAEAATRRDTNTILYAARIAKKLAKASAAKKKAKSEAAKKKADNAVKVATKAKKKADKAAAPAIEAREEHKMAVLYHVLQLELANLDESQLIRVDEILDDVQQEMGFATETANASDGAHDQQRLTTRKRKRPGRPKTDPETVKRDAELATAWCRARESGTQKIEFANDNGMTLDELQQLLNRVSKRRSRADK